VAVVGVKRRELKKTKEGVPRVKRESEDVGKIPEYVIDSRMFQNIRKVLEPDYSNALPRAAASASPRNLLGTRTLGHSSLRLHLNKVPG
jgi:hypothetical protein